MVRRANLEPGRGRRLYTGGWLIGLLLLAPAAWAEEVGLVTSLLGTATLEVAGAPATPLRPFVKLRGGDRVRLDAGGRLQLVYFEGGRQETWMGAAQLEIGATSSTGPAGSVPEVKTLPPVLVKQLAKTPSEEGNVKAGMVRLRSIPSGGTLESVEKRYTELRGTADPADRNPELYLLASYLELQEFDKLESLLQRMGAQSPGDMEVKVLTSLYKKAVRDARAAATH